jgi:hypothetical protein
MTIPSIAPINVPTIPIRTVNPSKPLISKRSGTKIIREKAIEAGK